MHFITVFLPFLYLSPVSSQGPLAGPEAESIAGVIKDMGFGDMGNLLEQMPLSDLTSFASLLTNNATLLLPTSIPNGTLSSLLSNTNKILPLLTYHIITAPISNTSVVSSPGHSIVPTALKDNHTVFLQGGSAQVLALTVEMDDYIHILDQSSDVTINKTSSFNIPLTDVSYGYAVISNLLSVPLGIIDTLATRSLKAFAGSASTSNVIDNISGQHGVTVFVPNDDAFLAANDTLGQLNSTQLAAVIDTHVLNGTFYSTTLGNSQCNVAGQNLSFNGSSISLPGGNAAQVVTADILTNNGVVYIIDTVLLTDSLKASVKNNAARSLTAKKWVLDSVLVALLLLVL